MDIVKSIEHEQLKNKVPYLKVGDTVKVHQRIKEGNRERIQIFEGIIIKKQGGGVNATFTVRRISYGVGVEKTFLVNSPLMEKVELVRVGKARRAKLYYLRDRIGKSAKTKEQIGARIEDKEIVLKEEIVPETVEDAPVAEEVAPAQEVATETTPVVEEVPVEAAPEEAPAIETTETVQEEVVDTVTEEVVEKVEEAPATAEEVATEVATEEASVETATETTSEETAEPASETTEEVKE